MLKGYPGITIIAIASLIESNFSIIMSRIMDQFNLEKSVGRGFIVQDIGFTVL